MISIPIPRPQARRRTPPISFSNRAACWNGTARGGGIDFELRPQQQTMARAVADAAGMGQHLAVEAGTGVGKSFAYLVPQILTALEHETRCVIATYTITLQEQLMHKDIPSCAAPWGATSRR
jgi:ATP-dependent DNA helicase DinG